MTPAIDLHGTLTEPDPQNPAQSVKVVYQTTAPGAGNISNGGKFDRQRRAHVIPKDPKTPAQLQRRARMAAAVAAWKLATPEDRSAYAEAARIRRITVCNAFISAFLRN